MHQTRVPVHPRAAGAPRGNGTARSHSRSGSRLTFARARRPPSTNAVVSRGRRGRSEKPRIREHLRRRGRHGRHDRQQSTRGRSARDHAGPRTTRGRTRAARACLPLKRFYKAAQNGGFVELFWLSVRPSEPVDAGALRVARYIEPFALLEPTSRMSLSATFFPRLSSPQWGAAPAAPLRYRSPRWTSPSAAARTSGSFPSRSWAAPRTPPPSAP
jgi:hypothetical protein